MAFPGLRRRLLPSLYLATVMAAVSSLGLAQSISVQIMTDGAVPADFGTSYSLGALDNLSYRYGPNFIVRVSYSNLSGEALSISLSGGQPNYTLAWRVDGTGDNNAFTVSLGADVTGLSGSASDQYYRNDGTLRILSSDATRYRLGAKSTPQAGDDLLVQVTLTATLY